VKSLRICFVARCKRGILYENLEKDVNALNFKGMNVLKCRREWRNSLLKAILIAHENVLLSDMASGYSFRSYRLLSPLKVVPATFLRNDQ